MTARWDVETRRRWLGMAGAAAMVAIPAALIAATWEPLAPLPREPRPALVADDAATPERTRQARRDQSDATAGEHRRPRTDKAEGEKRRLRRGQDEREERRLHRDETDSKERRERRDKTHREERRDRREQAEGEERPRRNRDREQVATPVIATPSP